MPQIVGNAISKEIFLSFQNAIAGGGGTL